MNAEQIQIIRVDLTMIGIILFFLFFMNVVVFSSISNSLSPPHLYANVITGSVVIFFIISYLYSSTDKGIGRGKTFMKLGFLYLGFAIFMTFSAWLQP
jgi:hypothetical protein